MEAISVTVSILKNKFQQQLLYRLPLNLLPADLATSSFGELSERLVGTLVAVPLGKEISYRPLLSGRLKV